MADINKLLDQQIASLRTYYYDNPNYNRLYQLTGEVQPQRKSMKVADLERENDTCEEIK